LIVAVAATATATATTTTTTILIFICSKMQQTNETIQNERKKERKKERNYILRTRTKLI